jgi:SAM-dependent methyltransferase
MDEPVRPTIRDVAGERIRRAIATWPETPSIEDLDVVLNLAARWRSKALALTYLARQGTIVHGGPFAGMDYVDATEGALLPRLLGTYESELVPHFDAVRAAGLDCVIDVGCAEGYYAVGLARRWPEVTVYAYDIEANARAACTALAAKNGVADRVVIGGEFRPEEFQMFAGRRALVLVDAEGAELDILQPDRAPALAQMSLIVETHDIIRQGALAAMLERFSPTHEIIRVDQEIKVFDRPWWLRELSHLDQLLAVWEWRLGPTPWLVMRPKSAG